MNWLLETSGFWVNLLFALDVLLSVAMIYVLLREEKYKEYSMTSDVSLHILFFMLWVDLAYFVTGTMFLGVLILTIVLLKIPVYYKWRKESRRIFALVDRENEQHKDIQERFMQMFQVHQISDEIVQEFIDGIWKDHVWGYDRQAKNQMQSRWYESKAYSHSQEEKSC